MKRWMIWFVLPMLLLVGCQKKEPVATRVVTRVQVFCHNGSDALYRQYTEQQDMRAMLNYLRLLDVGDQPEELPEDSKLSYKIVLEDNLGGQTVYRQLGSRCLCENDGPWHSIDGSKGSLLYPLLLLLPGDI
ncbi:MAG: hypothetical protein IJB47_00750 [Oscillospiraceae bacterium]|nr:hypothetical protein [Oscillospiraceae bacterium]